MRCNAPVQGHTRGGGANCPVHGGSYGRGYSYNPPRPAPRYPGGGGSSSTPSRSVRSSGGSASVAQRRTLDTVRRVVEREAKRNPDLRDLFLCHAWDDRKGAAKELHDLLEALGVRVWFSEKDVPLGSSLLREIDKGLKNSRIGIVLVTPELLARLNAEGIADKELSALLATDRLIPVTHGATYDDLRDVSPLLASRSGLSTEDSSLGEVAELLAESVRIEVEV